LRKSVKVMTYNVLKSTCSFSFYPHCDTQHMLFPYRYPLPPLLSVIHLVVHDAA
jgi:hypothetical protein